MQFPATICKELQEKAKTELNEDLSKIKANVNRLRKWFDELYPNANIDDRWLISFLRVSKYDIEKAKERIITFCTCKTVIPEFFSNRDPLLPGIQKALNFSPITILPNTIGPAEPRLLLCCTEFCDPNIVTTDLFAKIAYMAMDILCMEDPNTTIAGICGIIDLRVLNYKYVFQTTPSYVRKLLTCMQNAYPVRLKGIYFINAPVYFQAIYGIVKLFLSEKIKKRIRFYRKLDDIYEDIPRSVFPSDFGEASAYSELSKMLKLKLESYRDWFINDKQFCLDEAREGREL